MPVLNSIPVSLLPDEVGRVLRIPPGDGDTVRELLDFTAPLLQARALFRDAFIGRRENAAVEIGGRLFHSRVLARNLEGTGLVFPFILTIGQGLEKEASSRVDLLRQYYLETIGDLALNAAAEHLEAHLRNMFGLKKLGQMSPGSLEDWPLEEQRPLFTLLGDAEGRLGVRLTDSLLMIPRKSISGIFFPSEESFTSCRLCPRAPCPGRRSAYEPGLRRSYGLEDGAP